MGVEYVANELAYIKLDDFILESFNNKNISHLTLTEKLSNSKNSNLENINQNIINTKSARKDDFISDVYAISYKGYLIGLTFVITNNNLEIRTYLIDECKDMNLEELLRKELSTKLLEIYPQFNIIDEEHQFKK